MNSDSLPILPTSVIGSYAYPGWMLTALEKIDQGEYGETDIKELYDDACRNGHPGPGAGGRGRGVGRGDAGMVFSCRAFRRG